MGIHDTARNILVFCVEEDCYILEENDKVFHFSISQRQMKSERDTQIIVFIPFEGELVLPQYSNRFPLRICHLEYAAGNLIVIFALQNEAMYATIFELDL